MRQNDRGTDASHRIRVAEWLIHHGQTLLDSGSDAERVTSAGMLDLEPWQRALLEGQRALRRRATRRFPDPHKWLWTDTSLAQASDWWTACFKATLFPSGGQVVDACCGAGADLVAMAQRCEVIGIDIDPVLVQLATNNLRTHGRTAQIRCAPFIGGRLDHSASLHIDPDRRPAGRRTTVADEFSPSIATVLNAARQCAGTVVKLAPRTRFSPECLSEIQQHAIRVWVGNMGECRQQLALFGASQDQIRDIISCDNSEHIAVLTEPAQEQSSAIDAGATELSITAFAAEAQLHVSTRDQVDGYVHELHAVLHAADLHTAWAKQTGLRAVTNADGYFTSETPLESHWARSFEVIDIVGWDDRKVRKALRALKAGTVEVKNRCLRLDANRFQNRYSSPEGNPITILVTRIGDRVRAIIAKRV